MLRLIVRMRLDGRTIIDSVATEQLVNMIADRFQGDPKYTVTISYP